MNSNEPKQGIIDRYGKEHLKKQISIVAVSVITLLGLKVTGFSLPSFLLNLSGYTLTNETAAPYLIKEITYLVTGVKIEEPVTLITSLMPLQDTKTKIANSLIEVKAYFDQDENSHLTKEEAAQVAKLDEKKNNMEDLPDLSNVADVYTHYFTASGKMDFGLDMLERWDFKKLAQKKLRLDETKEGPQILIFHTHAREDYIGGKTVVDLGEALKKELEEKYGVRVLHNTEEFYAPNNHTKYVTKGEYERMEPVIKKVLEDNPSISVAMDIHRDGVGDVHLVTNIDGKQTAKIMFVNGLCLNRNIKGELEDKVDLPNPYLEDNLAFSLQGTMTMNAFYPGLSRKIFLNEWRYGTHMIPQSLLVEWGANTNTWEEALNGVEPFAKVLMSVLGKD